MSSPLSSFGHGLSNLLGWAYTFAWGISFYPQLTLNYKRKSVRGLSLDFLALNVFGFLCYSTSTTGLLLSPIVRKEYGDRHNGGIPNVRLNDLIFALHALLLTTLTWLQSFYYKRDITQRVSSITRTTLTLLSMTIICLVIWTKDSESISSKHHHYFQWIDLVIALSTIKVWISFAKYLPQAILNWRRKSTVGWSIQNIILDFTGGVLSLAQMILDAGLDNDWSSMTSNPGKLGIAILSISFDVVFLLQHYVLYPQNLDLPLYQNQVVDDQHNQEESESLIA
ncbi:hypothetical protein MJO28_017639 [Puccinia striiformis f. sp. tritici]|nr:hypothetical protein MJO28_017639 [Puccinia striiformis f. sp. tritici]KAI7939511.1 hypothetical protein MJO29_014247 [Puccinia striiformis f. sp. tritici]